MNSPSTIAPDLRRLAWMPLACVLAAYACRALIWLVLWLASLGGGGSSAAAEEAGLLWWELLLCIICGLGAVLVVVVAYAGTVVAAVLAAIAVLLPLRRGLNACVLLLALLLLAYDFFS